jgi:Periplasmic glycine betaine/choline-binding (lipo)protein of an ABC-type transport system (osmoprotectant binding protein)
MLRKTIAVAAITASGALALAGCSGGNPLSANTSGSGSSSGGTVVVGSANFPEDEIVAQIYTQALKANGVNASIKPNIGSREVYLAALKDGSIDLVPEYTGNLLQFYNKSSTAQTSDDVYAGLSDALPKGFEVLQQSKAEDKDSYNVTQAFSDRYHVKSLADLKNVSIPLKVAANPEFATRPYGIPGLKSVYGVSATLVPINDGGGPNTVKALQDGQVQIADIYSTTPAIKQNNFVTLADPQSLIVAQNVVPLINSSKASERVTTVLNKVSAALTTDDLIEMNTKSSGSAKESADQIATEWLASKHLFS